MDGETTANTPAPMQDFGLAEEPSLAGEPSGAAADMLAVQLAQQAMAQGDFARAEAVVRQAISAGEKQGPLFTCLGRVLLKQRKLEESAAALERALEIDPRDAVARYSLGVGQLLRADVPAGEASFRTAIEIDPHYVDARNALAIVLCTLGKLDEAIAELRHTLELHPESQEARSALIFAMDLWPEATVADQQRERRAWFEKHGRMHAARAPGAFANSRDPERRLRIGYVSADFRVHPAAMCCGPIIRYHDRTQVEVACYYGSKKEDVMTQSLRGAAQLWRSTVGVPDEALAAQIREDGIDILVDLSAHTAGHRLSVFARKPAPVQVTAWGFVNGTGFPTIDYMFSDPVCVPAEMRGLFAEKVVDLPCCLCYEPAADTPDVSPLPSLQGTPFTFGCVNRTEKMSDRAVAVWARILEAMPGSRLLLKSMTLDMAAVKAEVLRRFREHGVGPERLILQGTTNLYWHFKALDAVDLALDPFPHSGGITTAQTLWMGVPVVTLLGTTPPGRISASMLTALGLPDWIARDEDEYVQIALDFADDPAHLARMRAEMRGRIASSPIYSVRAYTRAVENAYRDIWRRWCRGAP